MKLVFNVSSDDQGCHPDDISVSMIRWKPETNSRHFADGSLKLILLKYIFSISMEMSMKFVLKVPRFLVQLTLNIMGSCSGLVSNSAMPLSRSMTTQLSDPHNTRDFYSLSSKTS